MEAFENPTHGFRGCTWCIFFQVERLSLITMVCACVYARARTRISTGGRGDEGKIQEMEDFF